MLNIPRLMNSVKEISIPVPWGKISGKWWGPTEIKPILCIHGFRDNCGSFDKLLPLITIRKNISFLAIDLPGHGLSTQFPRGMSYNFMDFITSIQLVYRYFNFSKMSFMGHSLGAMISFASTILYPDKVDCLICIDSLPPLQTNFTKETMRKGIHDFIRYNENTDGAPTYTFKGILEKMNNAYKGNLDLESILCLLERNIAASKEIPGKYYFTIDPVLKVRTPFTWAQEQIVKDAATLQNPILIFEAKQNNEKRNRKEFYEVVDVLKRYNKDSSIHTLVGPHHIHLSEAEKVSIPINSFLDKYHKVENCNLQDFSIFSPLAPSILSNELIKNEIPLTNCKL